MNDIQTVYVYSAWIFRILFLCIFHHKYVVGVEIRQARTTK